MPSETCILLVHVYHLWMPSETRIFGPMYQGILLYTRWSAPQGMINLKSKPLRLRSPSDLCYMVIWTKDQNDFISLRPDPLSWIQITHVCEYLDITCIIGLIDKYQSKLVLDRWKDDKKILHLQETKDYKLIYKKKVIIYKWLAFPTLSLLKVLIVGYDAHWDLYGR